MRILLLFMICQLSLRGQNYFYNVKKLPRSSAYYQCNVYKNRIFTFATNFCDNGYECSYVNELDFFGNIIWNLELPNIDIGNKSCMVYNDSIFVAGNYFKGEGKSIISKIDLFGNLINEKLISVDPNTYQRSYVLRMTSLKNKIILTGNCFIEERNKALILALKPNMVIDTILIDTTLELSTLWDSHVGTDGLLTCFYYQVNKFWPDQVRRIVKYDSDFNQVWSFTSDTLGLNPSYPYGTVLKDGRVVFVDFNPGWPTGLNALRCLDTITKQNDWMFIYPFQQSWGRKLRNVKQLRNGDIICTGEYITKASTPRIEGSPYMIRLDKDGNKLWERAYVEIAPDGEDKGGNLWDVVELENGDLMAVGFVTNDKKWDPLIIRTDHRGCMEGGTTNCPTVKIIDLMTGSEDEISDDDKMVISPNPAQDYIDITISDGMALPLRYEVKTISGHRVEVGTHSSTNVLSIAVDDFASGMYIVRMMDSQGRRWTGKWVKD